MRTDVDATLKAIRLVVDELPQRSPGEKVVSYTAVVTLCDELEQTLDPEHCIHHCYTRENLDRLRDAVAVLCGIPQLSNPERPGYPQAADRVESSLTLLNDPARWPSMCMLLDRDGHEIDGTNDPHRPGQT